MAIGPELPSQFVKRKRDSESYDSHSGSEKRKRIIGPALPPHPATSANPEEIDLKDEGSEDEGFQPPARSNGPGLSPLTGTTSTDTLKRTTSIGPAMPPRPSSSKDDDRSDDDDDDLGPAPPSAADALSSSMHPSDPRYPLHDPVVSSVAQPAKPQREDWMLAPPSGADWTARVDPTKLRNRRFAAGPRASKASTTTTTTTSTSSSSGPSDLWSETPEQKRQRLANQVLGISDSASSAAGAADSRASRQGYEGPAVKAGDVARRKQEEEEETAQRIQEYNVRKRGQSLYKMHQAKAKEDGQGQPEDDPSKRAFDREKDIAGGARLSFAKKREMMGKAADFGSRFSKGSYL